jgi:hypothetical protein
MRLNVNGIDVWTETNGTVVKVYSNPMMVGVYLIGYCDLFVSATKMPHWKVSLDGETYRTCSAQTQVQAVGALVLKWQLNQKIKEDKLDWDRAEKAQLQGAGRGQVIRGVSVD